MPYQEEILRFYDVALRLRSERSTYFEQFVRMYARFRQSSEDLPPAVHIDAAIVTDQEDDVPVLQLNGEQWPLQDHQRLDGYTYGRLLRAVHDGIRSHFLFHAGAVAHNGQGVILVADSMHGKTTLVLELVRRGFQFLSDEIAAISRTDGRVYPYPRRLSIRPGTLALMGLTPNEQAIRWFGNWAVDAEEIRPGAMGAHVPVHHLVFLKGENQGGQSGEESPALVVVVDRLTDAFLARVRALDAVEDVEVGESNSFPSLHLAVARQMAVLPAVEALCREEGIYVMDYRRRHLHQPIFASAARLEPLSRSQGLLELLRNLQSEYSSDLRRDEFGGDATSLFMSVAGLLDQVQCHRLGVGPLNQNADLVSSLVGLDRSDR